MRAMMPSTHSTKPTIAMTSAAVAFPDPVSRGLAAIIFLAFKALAMAIGSRDDPEAE